MTDEKKQEAVAAAEKKSGESKIINKKTIIGIIILALIAGYGIYAKNPGKMSLANLFPKTVSQDEAKTRAVDFIKNNLVPEGTIVETKSITEEGGLYKITISISGQEIVSYLTKDGTKFFPQAMDIAEVQKKTEESKQAQAPKDITKSDMPEVKLFVMSYCPFGTQMQKGILPVVAALGSKIKFSLEFVDYIMHGDKEITENLRQYCIQKTQPAKLSAYLNCFLKKGEGTEASCMSSTGVASSQVSSCIAETDAQFNITKDAADKSKWSNGQYPPFNVNKEDNEKYGVQGSPTLVINGAEASSGGRDSASILKTICGAFNTEPKECQAKLSSTAPAAGFGDGAAAANSPAADASCGN